MKQTLEEKLQNYIIDENDCWIWQGRFYPAGYGLVYHQGKCNTAHRTYYLRYVGPIPEGLELDHLCRVRACMNPAHLEIVTTYENTRRGNCPGARAVRTNKCSRGHDLVPGNYYRLKGNIRSCKECQKIRNNERYKAPAICLNCGKEFMTDKYKVDRRKFCTQSCAAIHMNKQRYSKAS